MKAAVRHQRADGSASLTVACDGRGVSRLRDLYQQAPCRILFPEVAPGEPLQAVLLTTTGGLTGGDRTSVALAVGANARATLTTQAAEKLYRALPGEPAVQCAVSIDVATDGWAEWLAQETILFNGARLRRAFCAELAAGSRMLAVESVVLGRKAMGEELQVGMLHDSWRIRRAGRLVWADALRLEGELGALRRAPFGFGDATACATLVYAADDAEMLLEPVRSCLGNWVAGAGVSLLNGLLVMRLLDADARRLRSRVISLAGLVRRLGAGLSGTLPRVWHC